MSWIRRCTVALGMLAILPPTAHSQARAALATHPSARSQERVAPPRASFGLLAKPADLEVRDVTLAEALDQLSARSGVAVAFSPSLISDRLRVSCSCRQATVGEALDQLLARTTLRYVDTGRLVFIEPVSTPVRSAKPSPGPASPVAAVEWMEVAKAGTLIGTVTDGRTLRPLAGAQVHVVGTGIGALTTAAGRYVLANVPVGPQTLRVEMIGFRAVERAIVVAEGEPQEIDVQLTEQAINLDEIVVTGTPGGSQVRAIGNVVERMDAAAIAQAAPAADVQQLIGQRTPGVTITSQPGVVGTGSRVVIRGASSLSLSNNPIIYVDGVRIDSNPNAGPNLRQGRQASRLNDIPAEDIESIEIIKGPAAATLYGTEASNGVIQIITKKGRQGPPVFEFALKQGATWMPNPAGRWSGTYFHDRTTGVTKHLNIFEHEKRTTGKDIFTTGHLQSFSANLKGGADLVRYYLSAELDDNVGIVDYNWSKRIATRANLSVVPNDKLDLSSNIGFVRSSTQFAQAATGFGIWDMIIYSNPSLIDTPTRGFRYATPEVAASVESISQLNRLTASISSNYRPWSWLHHRLNVGIDIGNTTNSQLFPRVAEGETDFFGARRNGEKTVEYVLSDYRTFDYAVTATRDLPREMKSATSFGVQYYSKQISTSSATGRNFPTPFVTTVGGAAVTTGFEDFIENKTLGAFLQQQVDWKNRVFLTAAVRSDNNSAFGANFNAAIYPKLSGAWVVSEEPFWSIPQINTFRLRSAWGQAGQQPDVFDAIKLYQPTTGPGNSSVVTPLTVGNPDLKPERGSELEVGFDAGLLEDRVDVGFTWYDRTTRDAIVGQRVRPSLGFPGVRIVNVGEVKNWGMELSANARVVERPRIGWTLGATFATHKSRVEDLGGLGSIPHGSDQEHREGYPISSIFTQRVVSAEFSPTGAVINAMCDGGPENGGQPVPCASAPKVYFGHPDPDWSGNINTTVTLMKNLQLYGLIDFQGGNTIISGDINGNATSFSGTVAANPATDPIHEAYRTVVSRTPLGTYDASFAKLREISLSYTVPERFTQSIGSSRASITGAWRNVATLWQAQDDIWGTRIFDVEMRTPSNERDARYQTTMPPTSQFITTIRVVF